MILALASSFAMYLISLHAAQRIAYPTAQLHCMQIRAACTDVRQDYRPPVTFLVVQKRHHTRLFPMSNREGDKSGNVMPGAHPAALSAAWHTLHCRGNATADHCRANTRMQLTSVGLFAGTTVDRGITVRGSFPALVSGHCTAPPCATVAHYTDVAAAVTGKSECGP